MPRKPSIANRYVLFANRLNDFCGRMVAWLVVVMILVTISQIILNIFHDGSRQAQDLIVYMFGILFLVGVSYTLRHDNHVRVDIFYNKMSPCGRAWVDLLGTLLFLLPFCIVLFWVSLPYVSSSWAVLEGSRQGGGIPAVFILKSFLLLMPVLLLIQGIANALVCYEIIRQHGSSDKTDDPQHDNTGGI